MIQKLLSKLSNYKKFHIDILCYINMKKKYIKCNNCGEKYLIKEKPDQCKCKHPYWNKPESEFVLFNLQDEFISSNFSERIFNKMYVVLNPYVKKHIVIKTKGKKIFSKEELEEKTNDTISKLYQNYISLDDFTVKASFSGWISYALLNILYNKKLQREEQYISLNTSISSENGESEFINSLSHNGEFIYSESAEESYFQNKEEDVINGVLYLIDSTYEIALKEKGFKYAHLLKTGINHHINKRRPAFIDRYYDFVGIHLKNVIEFNWKKIRDFLHCMKKNENFNVM